MLLLDYYINFFKQDFLTKFSYKNTLELLVLQKVVLRFSLTQTSLKNLLPLLTALFLITDQKPCLKRQKRLFLRLKTKSGVGISCKVDLRKKAKFNFLEKVIFFIKPHMKNFSYDVKKNKVDFFIDNLYLFKELEKSYDYLQELPHLKVSLVFNTSNSAQINYFLELIKF